MNLRSARRRASRRFPVYSIVLALAATGLAFAPNKAVSSSGPPRPDSALRAAVICGFASFDGWGEIGRFWRLLGSVPVTMIDDPTLCSDHFTLADLEASRADTIVFDAVGVIGAKPSFSYQPKTIQAIETYAAEGHTLLGAYTAFGTDREDNNAFAPVFGLAKQDTWRISGGEGESFTFLLNEDDPAAPVLLRDVPNHYLSSNVGATVKPTDSHWSANELAGARYIGRNSDHHTAITIYDSGGYNAIYIADTADVESTSDDLQFLYNAIIYPRSG